MSENVDHDWNQAFNELMTQRAGRQSATIAKLKRELEALQNIPEMPGLEWESVTCYPGGQKYYHYDRGYRDRVAITAMNAILMRPEYQASTRLSPSRQSSVRDAVSLEAYRQADSMARERARTKAEICDNPPTA